MGHGDIHKLNPQARAHASRSVVPAQWRLPGTDHYRRTIHDPSRYRQCRRYRRCHHWWSQKLTAFISRIHANGRKARYDRTIGIDCQYVLIFTSENQTSCSRNVLSSPVNFMGKHLSLFIAKKYLTKNILPTFLF